MTATLFKFDDPETLAQSYQKKLQGALVQVSYKRKFRRELKKKLKRLLREGIR